jgi:hypothetical protein
MHKLYILNNIMYMRIKPQVSEVYKLLLTNDSDINL